jgi:multicomponent K+:H+ antiporter subunit A
MVKAGVFLLARLWPVLAGTDLWFGIVCAIGLASLLLGACAATFQRDMKGVLAYSTISHLGLITLLLGLNSELALVAAVFHMMNHATFKASLFMAAGIVDHESGTRDLTRLRGLARAMPVTATLALVAAAAMAGVPLLNGFLSKEMFFAETIFAIEAPLLRIALPVVATVASAFSVAYSIRFVHRVFMGPRASDLPRTPHEPTGWMLAPSALLVTACVLVGTLPAVTVGPALQTGMQAILGTDVPPYSLSVWHGLTAPLVMSIAALAGGGALYALLYRRWDGALRPAPFRPRVDGKRRFVAIIVGLIRTADRLVRLLHSRRLQPQLAVLIGVVVAIVGATALSTVTLAGPRTTSPVNPAFALLWTIGAACAVGAAINAKFHRLAALAMAGGAGLVTCLTFAWFSAPDVALTQISVEIVTLVLLLLGLRWLPKRSEAEDRHRQTPRARARRARDFVIAVVAGTGMATLAYAMLTRPSTSALSQFFLENALPLGGGHNVVNVILVDFRGFDTLGEITVVGIVALTVYKLLRRFRPAPESIALSRADPHDAGDTARPVENQALPVGYMMVPAVLGRLLLPIAGVVSIFFLLRGHDAPGGGFVGGLVVATAFIVQYMVNGTLWLESRIRIHPQYWIGTGLLCAAGAGAGAWLASRNFLASMRWDLRLLSMDVHLSSTLLFDLGVYLLVVGSTILIVIALAHQSMRTRREPLPEDAVTKVWHAPETASGGAP